MQQPLLLLLLSHSRRRRRHFGVILPRSPAQATTPRASLEDRLRGRRRFRLNGAADPATAVLMGRRHPTDVDVLIRNLQSCSEPRIRRFLVDFRTAFAVSSYSYS